MSRGTTTRPRLSVQPRSPSTWTPRATGPKWSSRTLAARRDGGLHAPGGLALGALDLGRVDGLAAAGQVQRGGEQADRDGQGELGPQERPGRRVVELGGADLAQPAGVAGEVVGQGRPRPTLDQRSPAAMAAREARASFHQRSPVMRSNAWPAAQASRVTGLSRNRARATPMVSWPAAGGPPVGRRWPSWLSYSGRPGCPQPQVGRCRPQRGIVGVPAAPAPRVLGMPAHPASPPAGR